MNKTISMIKSCLVSLGFLLCLQNKCIPLTLTSLSTNVLIPLDGMVYATNNAPLNIDGRGNFFSLVSIINTTPNPISYNIIYNLRFSIDQYEYSNIFNTTLALDPGGFYSAIVSETLPLTGLLGYGEHKAVTKFSVTVDNIFTPGIDTSIDPISDTNTFSIVPVPLAGL